MINKKAESDSRTFIFPALIAIILLAIVLLGFFGKFDGLVQYFKNLGSFNTTQPPQEGVELVRYDISSDNVQWYDGLEWHDFGKDGQFFGDKTVKKEPLLNDFADGYYFDRALPFTLQFEKTLNPSVDGTPRNYRKRFSVEDFSPEGDIFILTQFVKTTIISNYFKLTLKNELLERTDNQPNRDVGRIDGMAVNGWFFIPSHITTEDSKDEFSSETEEHLKIIQEPPLPFPYKIQDFKIQENTLEEGAIELGILQEIKLEKEYTLRKIKSEENLLSYQFYHQGDPLEIFVDLTRTEDGGKFELETNIRAREVTKDDYILFNYISDPENEIISKVSQWRDAVLSKTITINYEEEDKKKSDTFCVEKFDNIYLVVDLGLPKTTC
jgi:hypothetical protein